MVTGGYQPSRDRMVVIVRAARKLYRSARRWQRHAQLPGYPVEMGNRTATEGIFLLERALNPGCLAWDNPSRKPIDTQCWPIEAGVGLAWLRNLLDLVIERNQLQSLASEVCFSSWSDGENAVPNVVTISDDEIAALGHAIRLLPGLKDLPEAPPSQNQPAVRGNDFHGTDSLEEPHAAVQLIGPRISPFVLGKRKSLLTSKQYRVVKCLIDAGPEGLKLADLVKKSGYTDAVGILRRVAEIDGDWGSVINMSGKTRCGYRIAWQNIEALPTTEAREDSAGSEQSIPTHNTTPYQSTS